MRRSSTGTTSFVINVIAVLVWSILIITPRLSNGRHINYADDHSGRKLASASDILGSKNIDCGAPENYFNEIGKYFENDTTYVDGGESIRISLELTTKDLWQQFKYVRSFPRGKRHCYSMQPKEEFKNHTYLITASFMYGNYDGKNTLPKFDIYLGVVTLWKTVQFMDASQLIFIDAIIALTSTTTADQTLDVCLVDTDTGTPFISALQFRPLKSDSMYQLPAARATSSAGTKFFSLVNRFDCGSNQTSNGGISRYQDDVYDRIWQNYTTGQELLSTNQSNFATENDSEQPPPDVLQTAILPLSGRDIEYVDSGRYTSSDEFVVYLHFAEMVESLSNRSFTITLNNGASSTVFTLTYMSPVHFSNNHDPIQGGVQFSLAATPTSTLKPILNAFEIFQVLDVSELATDTDDVTAMKDIKLKYGIAIEDWQGDPCVPKEYTWNGLICNSDKPARVISLNLSSSGLAGKIAPSLSQMNSLEILDLSFNNLTGSVPESFAQLSSLKVLNLTGNKLEGSLPEALLNKYRFGLLTISSLDGNPKLCFPNPCERKSSVKWVPILIAIVASVFICVVLMMWVCIKKRGNLSTWNWIGKLIRGHNNEGKKLYKRKSSLMKYRSYTFEEVRKITKDFKKEIGKGGSGKVYRGKLFKDECPRVAVKIFSPESDQGIDEFRNEVKLLMKVRHKNLVSFVGYCDSNDKMAIIYEYEENSSLDRHLSTTSRGNILPWHVRLQIALDTAQGLEYLHTQCEPYIVHRDLKPANILLTKDFKARIADFGISKLFPTQKSTSVPTKPKGTPAYMDPELINTERLNTRSDIYSFGVVLLELITGRAAVNCSDGSNDHISKWIERELERKGLEGVVDSRFEENDLDYNPESVKTALDLARECVRHTAVQRPEIASVSNELRISLKLETDFQERIRRGGEGTNNNENNLYKTAVSTMRNWININ